MSPVLAINAKPIMDARLRGFKPADMVLVSMCGHVESENPVVRAIPGNDYDWRWVRGLDVCMYVADRNDWVLTIKAIALHRPEHLSLWNCFDHWGASVYLIPTEADISKSVRSWTYELDFLPWLDFQNDDFIAGRTYSRTTKGFPRASHS